MLPPVVRALLALSAAAAPALAAAQPPADTTRRPPSPDTLRVDSVRTDGARRDTLLPDVPGVDGLRVDGLRVDSVRVDSVRVDSVRVDSAPGADRAAAAPRASWLAAEAVRAPVRLPISGGSGARVLHVQVLLGAAGFSPGVLDGRWQAGTRAAVRAFRAAHGLGAGEAVNADTYARLVAAAQERPTVVDYRISRDDLRAPLRKIPAGYHDKAKLEWLGYETVAERLAERFHTTPGVLKELNPGVDLEKVVAGTVLVVPNVWRLPPRAAPARLVVDKRVGMLHGYDADGGLLFALRASVGSTQTPSPTGLLKVRSITRYPWYQYNPRVLAGDASVKGRTADLPPGPNSPVGVVWIQLSKAHIGIHGTPEPARVGSGQSHGCVRLTNWDALFLASALSPGVEVEFL